MNDVPLKDGNGDFRVHWFELVTLDEHGKEACKNSWVRNPDSLSGRTGDRGSG